jgi:serine/threonine-protein kinase
MFYEMLSGVPPFEAETQGGLFLMHRTEPVPAIAARSGVDVPPEIEAVAQKLLAKTQEERFQRADEVLKALDAADASISGELPADEPIEPEPISLSVAGAAPPRSLPRFEDVAEGTPEPSVTEEAVEAAAPRAAARQVTKAPAAPRKKTPWLALGAVAAAGIGAVVVVRSGLLSTSDTGHAPRRSATASAASAPPVASAPRRSAEPSATPPPPTPTVTATAVGGLDAEAWVRIVRQAPTSKDYTKAIEGLLALAELDPTALAPVDMRQAAVEIVVAASNDRAKGAALVKALSERFGSDGVDALYDLVTTRGGSHAAGIATPMLQKAEVRARGTPALRAALELREAPCSDKPAVLERVKADGDERTLAIVSSIRAAECDASAGECCLRENPAVEVAARELADRLKK